MKIKKNYGVFIGNFEHNFTSFSSASIVDFEQVNVYCVACMLKVAYRVQIWKKAFCQNSDKFGYSFI